MMGQCVLWNILAYVKEVMWYSIIIVEGVTYVLLKLCMDNIYKNMLSEIDKLLTSPSATAKNGFSTF